MDVQHSDVYEQETYCTVHPKEKFEVIKGDGLVLTNQSKLYRFMKRVCDVLFSSIALVVLSPVMLVTAVAIRLDSPGRVIYSQLRSGKEGKPFKMYKFRSMCSEAEKMHLQLLKCNELDGPAFKMKNDPRITRVGKFIRRTSIDELPQLINIIRGDMSIVGPRPLPLYESKQCSDYHNQRLLVKPGLTCFWQVSGRSDIPFEEWMELDLKYLKERGVITDVKIIAKTFATIFKGGGLLDLPISTDEAESIVGRQEISFYENTNVAYAFLKRFMDILCSLTALAILSPVLLLTSIAIYLEDKGSIFYRQKRIGMDEKEFYIYKFRSMKSDAEQIHEILKQDYGSTEISFKLKHDPRVTRVGGFIRKLNIDELPQLFNILKGEMSIVGPRPLPVYEFKEERSRYGMKYKQRYAVPQGLTCYWQVSNRAQITFEERMGMDVKYSAECGLLQDIWLILKTMWQIICGRSGY